MPRQEEVAAEEDIADGAGDIPGRACGRLVEVSMAERLKQGDVLAVAGLHHLQKFGRRAFAEALNSSLAERQHIGALHKAVDMPLLAR